jgi:hypothetical protein
MLTLPIKKKWYDMILSGQKKEEYREVTPYYTERFRNAAWLSPIYKRETVEEYFRCWPGNGTSCRLILKNGYSYDSPAALVTGRVRIGKGRPEWGAEAGKEYYIFTIETIEVLCSGKWREET